MDSANEESATPSRVQTGGSYCTQAAHEDKLTTDVNAALRAPMFYDEDPELWFWQLEATFTVNKVTTEKDKYAVVVSNLPYKII